MKWAVMSSSVQPHRLIQAEKTEHVGEGVLGCEQSARRSSSRRSSLLGAEAVLQTPSHVPVYSAWKCKWSQVRFR